MELNNAAFEIYAVIAVSHFLKIGFYLQQIDVHNVAAATRIDVKWLG
jgi:hypothetical protein